jgi:hypothetical protein
MDTENSIIMQKILPTKQIVYLILVMLQWTYCFILFTFFSNVWWMLNILSVSDEIRLIHSVIEHFSTY